MIKAISDSSYLVKRDGKNYYILGTAHISSKSSEEVSEFMEKYSLESVAIELCKSRFEKIKFKNVWLNTSISDVISKKEHLIFLLNILLSSYQKSIGEKLGVMPGSEFITAISESKKRNKKVYLVDRNIGITLKRAFQKIGIFEKTKILFSIFASFFAPKPSKEVIEELKKEDLLSKALEAFSKIAPNLKRVLIDERDEYIAKKVSKIDSESVLVVVGAGHAKSIANYLDDQTKLQSISLSKLEQIKQKRKFPIFSWLLSVLFIALIIMGFWYKGLDVGLYMLFLWVLSTGGFASLFTLIGGGHLISAMIAFVVAPLTSVHPLLASGWFVGLSELKYSSPRVQDFFSLKDIVRFKDLRRNRVVRVLWIVTMTNIGTVIGTLVGFPLLISLLI